MCPDCVAAKRLLEINGLKFGEIRVVGNQLLAKALFKRSGGHTVPRAGDYHIGSLDASRGLEQVGRGDNPINSELQP